MAEHSPETLPPGKAKRRNVDPPLPEQRAPDVEIWAWTETALERAIRAADRDMAEPI